MHALEVVAVVVVADEVAAAAADVAVTAELDELWMLSMTTREGSL